MIARLFIVSLLLSSAAVASGAEPVVIVFEEQAQIDRVDVRLRDVATVRTADAALRGRLEEIRIGLIPRPGSRRTFRRDDVLRSIARTESTTEIVGTGADRTTVEMRSKVYPASALRDSARAHLAQHLREQYPALARIEVEAAGDVPDVQVPTGELTVSPRALRDTATAKRVCVWLDMQLNGKVYRSVPVWLTVKMYAPALAARHPIKPRERVGSGDFDFEERDIAGIDPAALATLASIEGQRARTFIATGAVVQAKDLEPNPAVFAEAPVDVRVVAGSILIETRAIAEQDGYVGDYVRVRNPKTAAIFSARVVGDGLVAVLER